MAKNYIFVFGSGNPTSTTGLAPTFIAFKTVGGSNIVAPGITEIPTGSGIYYTSYGPTNTIAFVLDGFTTGLGSGRYIPGSMDPVDAVDEYLGSTFYPQNVTMTALGTTAVALFGASFLGASLSALSLGITGISDISARIGTTASSYGSTSVNPGTLYGYLKRLQEWNEGNSNFDKSTSLWDVYSRGSSTLLAEKTLNDSSGNVTKT